MLLRRFSTSNRTRIYARSVFNPGNYALPARQEPACIIFATEAALSKAISAVSTFHQSHPKVQLCVAGVNTIAGLWNGVSELWVDSKFSVSDIEQISTGKSTISETGGRILLPRDNWRLSKAHLLVMFGNNKVQPIDVKLRLANTIFCTGLESTLFFIDNGKVVEGLKSANIEISSVKLAKNVITEDKWTPLFDPQDNDGRPLLITKCVGNLAKEINGQSALGFLQDNDRLMSLQSKDTKVYVKLTKSTGVEEKHEVIAGGGGWGSKASTIAISPPAKLQRGDQIEFFMLTPTAQTNGPDKFETRPGLGVSALFECLYERNSYGLEGLDVETKVEGLFGGGSEGGFELNGIKHVSVGERAEVRFT